MISRPACPLLTVVIPGKPAPPNLQRFPIRRNAVSRRIDTPCRVYFDQSTKWLRHGKPVGHAQQMVKSQRQLRAPKNLVRRFPRMQLVGDVPVRRTQLVFPLVEQLRVRVA